MNELDPKDLLEIKLQMGRVVSHIESEERNRERHEKMLADHNDEIYGSKDRDGLRNKVKTLEDYMRERKKINYMILACVLSLVVKNAYDIFQHAVK